MKPGCVWGDGRNQIFERSRMLQVPRSGDMEGSVMWKSVGWAFEMGQMVALIPRCSHPNMLGESGNREDLCLHPQHKSWGGGKTPDYSQSQHSTDCMVIWSIAP